MSLGKKGFLALVAITPGHGPGERVITEPESWVL